MKLYTFESKVIDSQSIGGVYYTIFLFAYI